MVASGMWRRTLLAGLVMASPAVAQPVPAPDCTVDGALSGSNGLSLEVTYRCRASASISWSITDSPSKVSLQ